jgi:hypothetical protein
MKNHIGGDEHPNHRVAAKITRHNVQRYTPAAWPSACVFLATMTPSPDQLKAAAMHARLTLHAAFLKESVINSTSECSHRANN